MRRVVFATAVLGGLAVLFFLDPAKIALFPPCPFHRLTSWDCPTCGTMRALHQLAHGHVVAAFRLNPLTMSLLPVAVYFAVRGRRLAMKPAALWALLGMVVAFSVWRNIPGG